MKKVTIWFQAGAGYVLSNPLVIHEVNDAWLEEGVFQIVGDNSGFGFPVGSMLAWKVENE